MKRKFKVRKIHVYLTLVLLVLGFMVSYSVQFNVNNFGELSALRDSEWDKKVKLNEKILSEKDKNIDLHNQLGTIRSEVDRKEKELSKNTNGSIEIVDELDMMRMQAGLIPVTGRGIVFTLDDSKNPRANDPNSAIVHDKYIRDVVNELFAAGAEGISINDERLAANWTVRCVGPTVTVNDTKLAPPYVIRAIGNDNALYTAMYMPGGVVELLRNKGLEVNVKKATTIDLPGYISKK